VPLGGKALIVASKRKSSAYIKRLQGGEGWVGGGREVEEKEERRRAEYGEGVGGRGGGRGEEGGGRVG